MNLFKQTTWKWWELKVIGWGGLCLGIAVGIQFADALINYSWLFWLGFIVFWTYVLVAWFKK
ncbi:MAG: hypothetical protein HN726_04350 [Candidatus Magasanikbacteria bacterium]|jgi:hypothetical protein|nr:hypothetical protein [Candidatus Magasanikbacteria bacterium]MBT4220833.1 hypothetical protein [Candidatus Magasanikbacteria bacterium]MBT4350178.1 hypothetical protein [Candidatus Magasanikbacteria bacterium]MBT4541379.1 hypothetical protein [Candidatus Magasanikbacteria bacterium]MBT6253181.1 hypothetical protein [Candidatus Magasanikbacteria bacterium]